MENISIKPALIADEFLQAQQERKHFNKCIYFDGVWMIEALTAPDFSPNQALYIISRNFSPLGCFHAWQIIRAEGIKKAVREKVAKVTQQIEKKEGGKA